MGNVNMEAYQVHYKGDESVSDHLRQLDLDVEKAAVLPDLPTAEGKTVLTAITDDQGDTELTYETPEVESEDIAPAFSEETEYSEGDLVYYDGILYKFAVDHTAGAWDPSEVTQTTVAAEFNELKNTLSDGAEVSITSISAAPEGVSLYSNNSKYAKNGKVACLCLHITVPAITVGSTINFILNQYPSNARNSVSISGYSASTAFLGIIAKSGQVSIRVLGANLAVNNTVVFYAIIPLEG